MSINSIKTPLEVSHYYHVYNRGNNKEKLFITDEHYKHFLALYEEIVAPGVSTFAYCLLPNHFHFLIRIEVGDEPDLNAASHLFRRFFQRYAIWFNHKENRRGSLFTKYFRRIEVKDEFYLQRLAYYIHRNPSKHGLTSDFTGYQYSSFNIFLNNKPSFIAKDEVLAWFNNDVGEFRDYHHLDDEKPDIRELYFDERELD